MTILLALTLLAPATVAVVALVRQAAFRVPTVLAPPAESSHEPDEMRRWRLRAKSAVVAEVCAGRLSLTEAAAVFAWLNQQPPANPTDDVKKTSAAVGDFLAAAGDSEVALLCLQVILWMPDNETPEATRRAIEDQFWQVCRAPGGVTLPPVLESECQELLARAAAADTRVLDTRANRPLVSAEGLRLVACAAQ
jgi:hypothetical protein